MTEQAYPCPKCGNPFPLSQLHDHFQSCQGKPQQQAPPSFPSFPQFPQQQPQFNPQGMNPYDKRDWPPPQNPMYVAPPVPQHQHQWYENDTYKVCISFLNPKTAEDVACRAIKMKLKGTWFIFVRYGLKLFWIQLVASLALAFSLASLYGVHH